jgi:lipoprotein signal peptidase
MQILYFCILILAAVMEFSPSFNTDNSLKKLALLLIIMGALAHLADRNQPLLEIGVVLYMAVELCGCLFFDTFERRHKDEPKKRKLLS